MRRSAVARAIAHPRPGAAARWPALVVALAVVALAACRTPRTPADDLAERSLTHLAAAVELLERHAGDMNALVSAVLSYRTRHHADLRALREQGERATQAMSPAQREAFVARHRPRAVALGGRIEALSQRYPDRRLAMRVVRPLIVAATPRGIALAPGQEPPWLPPLPPLPEGATPIAPPAPGHAHDHDHGVERGPPPRPGAGVVPSAVAP
jgi:hypothetical protein